MQFTAAVWTRTWLGFSCRIGLKLERYSTIETGMSNEIATASTHRRLYREFARARGLPNFDPGSIYISSDHDLIFSTTGRWGQCPFRVIQRRTAFFFFLGRFDGDIEVPFANLVAFHSSKSCTASLSPSSIALFSQKSRQRSLPCQK